VARIQLSGPDNCVILPDPDLESEQNQQRKIFVGVEHVASISGKWLKARKRGEQVMCLVVGARRSGTIIDDLFTHYFIN
jgi:hypothetical protein